MGLPQLDVLMTAYNRADTIRLALESILHQSFDNFKILVVNDGSTDATGQIVGDIAACDARVSLINTEHKGIVSAANIGLRFVTAPFLARMDADDISEPERFKIQLCIFENDPSVVAASGAHDLINLSGEVIGKGFVFEEPMKADPLIAPNREPYLPHPFVMVRMSAMEQIGRQYRHFVFAEDVDLYWRLRDIGRLVNTTVKLGSYRIHRTSATAKSVFHGRVSATYSQLAGISELRRLGGVQDILIDHDPLLDLDSHDSLDEITDYAAASVGLSEQEKRFLKACAGAKLLELLWRGTYKAEAADYQFMDRWLRPDFLIGNTWSNSIRGIDALIHKHFGDLIRAHQYYRAFLFSFMLRKKFLGRFGRATQSLEV
jgi:glycosyltransferase involved in cell wall biosynthesis